MFAMMVEKSVSPLWKVTVLHFAPPAIIASEK